MPDYESMYYELLLASQQSIKILEDAVRASSENIFSISPSPSAALYALKTQCYKASDMLFSAAQKCETIYADTYYDDSECSRCTYDSCMILD